MLFGELYTYNMQGFIGKHADDRSTVYADDYKSYEDMSFNHKTVKHSVGEFVNRQVHVNGVKSFWDLLKRGYYGTFHHISPKCLHRYVNEFANRRNLRKYDTEKMMQEIYASMIGKRLMYEDLIA